MHFVMLAGVLAALPACEGEMKDAKEQVRCALKVKGPCGQELVAALEQKNRTWPEAVFRACTGGGEVWPLPDENTALVQLATAVLNALEQAKVEGFAARSAAMVIAGKLVKGTYQGIPAERVCPAWLMWLQFKPTRSGAVAYVLRQDGKAEPVRLGLDTERDLARRQLLDLARARENSCGEGRARSLAVAITGPEPVRPQLEALAASLRAAGVAATVTVPLAP